LILIKHVSFINIVDARNFHDIQTIRVSPQGSDQHITGMSFSADSKALFVGLEHSVVEYEIDTIRRRCFPDGSLN
jgi:secreted PhoX family phosphatase